MLKYIIVIYFASEYILLQKILGEVLFAKGQPLEEIKLKFLKNQAFLSTAKRKLERFQFSTSSSFFKI